MRRAWRNWAWSCLLSVMSVSMTRMDSGRPWESRTSVQRLWTRKGRPVLETRFSSPLQSALLDLGAGVAFLLPAGVVGDAQTGSVAAEDFGRAPAIQVFGAPVPIADGAVQVQDMNGVLCQVQHPGLLDFTGGTKAGKLRPRRGVQLIDCITHDSPPYRQGEEEP